MVLDRPGAPTTRRQGQRIVRTVDPILVFGPWSERYDLGPGHPLTPRRFGPGIDLIRAVTAPYPGAFAFTPQGERMLIWWGLPEGSDAAGKPGSVVEEGGAVFICAGAGRLRLIDIEINGKRLKNGEISEYFRQQEGERQL